MLHARDPTLSDHETKWFDKPGGTREQVFDGKMRRGVAQAKPRVPEVRQFLHLFVDRDVP